MTTPLLAYLVLTAADPTAAAAPPAAPPAAQRLSPTPAACVTVGLSSSKSAWTGGASSGAAGMAISEQGMPVDKKDKKKGKRMAGPGPGDYDGDGACGASAGATATTGCSSSGAACPAPKAMAINEKGTAGTVKPKPTTPK